ncbi:uncharacterized protein L199_008509 [Kwoniella botswanensis]|uniref:uncharacterized protein n=1 Tax=Kwoniella botswanensis TaxID=1268659 RepID=UPI00315DA96E
MGLPYAESWWGENSTRLCRGSFEPPNPRYLSAYGYPSCAVGVSIIDPIGHWTRGGCYNLSESPNANTFHLQKNNADFSVSCMCSILNPTDFGILYCYYGEPYYYYHTPQPSSFVKKSKKEGQKVLDVCPEGSRACKVTDEYGLSYECIDIDNALESCGGCAHGDFEDSRLYNHNAGIDCTSLSGVSLCVECLVTGEYAK